jgi:hypothetical protein
VKLFLPFSGVNNAVELLEPDKLVGVIACSESIWVLFRPVAFHTTFKIGGNAGVENFVTAIRCYVCPGFHLLAVPKDVIVFQYQRTKIRKL